MGTEFINQAGLKRVEFYRFNREISVGPGELSLKRGAYKYGDAFILLDQAGYLAFAYLSMEQLKILRDQIDKLIDGEFYSGIDGWYDEGYGTGADGPGQKDEDGNILGSY